jgi:hypothetical protein
MILPNRDLNLNVAWSPYEKSYLIHGLTEFDNGILYTLFLQYPDISGTMRDLNLQFYKVPARRCDFVEWWNSLSICVANLFNRFTLPLGFETKLNHEPVPELHGLATNPLNRGFLCL